MATPRKTLEAWKASDFVPSAETVAHLRERAKFVRLETIRLIEIAKTGHYTSVFSAAELFSALYYDVMNLRPEEPGWAGRDRFLMGKGHAAVGQFPILADLGMFPKAWLDDYTRLGSPLGDHPDMRKVPASTSLPAPLATPFPGAWACAWPSVSLAKATTCSSCSVTAKCRKARSGKLPWVPPTTRPTG